MHKFRCLESDNGGYHYVCPHLHLHVLDLTLSYLDLFSLLETTFLCLCIPIINQYIVPIPDQMIDIAISRKTHGDIEFS